MHALCDEPGGHVAEELLGLDAAHLPGAVVHIEDRFPDPRLVDEGFKVVSAEAQGRGQGRAPGKVVVVGHEGIDGHEPAHGGAADEGELSLRQGGEVLVDVGLEFVHQVAHGDLAPAPYLAPLGVVEVEGGVLGKPPAALLLLVVVAALDGRDDQGDVVAGHVFEEPPALAEGGVRVPEQVLPVEHIEHRVAALIVHHGGVGHVDVGVPGLVPRQFRNGDLPLLIHGWAFLLRCKDLYIITQEKRYSTLFAVPREKPVV